MAGTELASVLVVDDVPEASDLLVRALRSTVDVVVATSAEEALALLRAQPFLAVVSDFRMPGSTGIDLLEKVAHLFPATYRILISAFPSGAALTEAINRGHVEQFYAKPFDPQELVHRIRALLARSPEAPTQRALVCVGPDLHDLVRDVMGELRMAFDISASVADLRESTTPYPPFPYNMVLWDTGISPRPMEALGELRRIAEDAALVCIVDRRGANQAELQPLGRSVDEMMWRPVKAEELAVRLRRALERRRTALDRGRRVPAPEGFRELLGKSAAMRPVFATVEKVAPTDSTILIRGETGTGKEVVARVVHALSRRKDMPFVAVHCASLPEGLVESELFGHERGAFTGALVRRPGRIESADGGTLFIDEVGEIPLGVQVKLLRVLQERTLERVGGNQSVDVDIRIVAATHRDLESMVTAGAFRQDLYYRLAVVPIDVPALRDRDDDVLLLADYFLREFQRRMQKTGIRLSGEATEVLRRHRWPGNVRELANVIERTVALTPSQTQAQTPELLDTKPPPPTRSSRISVAPGQTLREMVADFEREVIRSALQRTGGNRTHAARLLGLTRQGLALKLGKHKLK